MVDARHTMYTAETRHLEEGMFMSQSILKTLVYLHESADLAVLHLMGEDGCVKNFRNVDVDPNYSLLTDNSSISTSAVSI